MATYEDDEMMLRRVKETKKNERKDEATLTQVERINDSLSRVENRLLETDNDYMKTCSYYEKEMKQAEDICEREIQKIREQMEAKIQAIETKRDQKLNYFLSQLSLLKAKHESRRETLEKIVERKEKRLELTATKITTKKGKEALANEVVLPSMPIPVVVTPAPKPTTGPTCSAEERKAAQTFLNNGGSIHAVKDCFPNFWAVMKQSDMEAERRRANMPEARQARAEAEMAREAQRLEEEQKNRIMTELGRKKKETEAHYKALKAKGAAADDVEVALNAHIAACDEFNVQRSLLFPHA